MRKLLWCLYCVLACLSALSGCDEVRDPRPATLQLWTYKGGATADCWVLLFSADGRQLQEAGSSGGKLTLDTLNAGSYVLRFQGPSREPYPAEVEFRLYEAGEIELHVDLDKPGSAALRQPTAS